MSLLIITEVRTAHCKLGPERCETCRDTDVAEICLLEVDPPDRGMVQRRVMEVTVAGETSWREYDVIRSFETVEEARSYADVHGIDVVDL